MRKYQLLQKTLMHVVSYSVPHDDEANHPSAPSANITIRKREITLLLRTAAYLKAHFGWTCLEKARRSRYEIYFSRSDAVRHL
jgi:hypothetical protein